MNPVQLAAIAAMDLGWAVFPVDGKVPCTLNGVNDASKEHRLVPIWFERWPRRGVALATGKVSGVFVVDLDGPAAVEEFTRLQEQHGALPKTVSAKTSRGFHVYFKHPENGDVRNSASKVAPGIDVRGSGGYVVIPPSPHPDGGAYAWSPGRSPDDTQVASAPDWLLNLVRAPAQGTQASAPLPNQIAEGSRNATLASLAGSLRRRGASRDAIFAAISVENEQRCVPQLPAMEVEQIADSVARYAPAPIQPDPTKDASGNGNGKHQELAAEKPPLLEVIDLAVLARMRDEKLKPISVVPTPWSTWNAVSRGAGGGEGLAHGWHVVVGASSGAGKSLCATNLAAQSVRSGEHVCLISLEMSQAEVVTRLLAIYADEDVRKLEHGRQFDVDAWNRATDLMQEAGGSIRVNPEPISRLEQIAAAIGRYADEGCRVFIIDYLQLAWVRNAETMIHQITEVSHTIRGLARSKRVLTIGLSQLNRVTSGAGGELRKEGLLGGSSLENDADQVLLLGKPTMRDFGRYQSEVKLDKNRHGPPVEWTMELDTRTLRLREVLPDEQPSITVEEPRRRKMGRSMSA